MYKSNRKVVAAITLSGLLMALSIAVQRFLVIPFGMPSLYRLSLGNVPIILASLFLGPIYGGIVGAGADVVGATLFPVANFLPWPLISSTLYGVLPWLLMRGIFVSRKKMKFSFIYPLLALIFILLEVYIFTHSSIRHPFDRNLAPIVFDTNFRILFSIILVAMMVILIFVFIYLEKKYGERVNLTYTGKPSELGLILLVMATLIEVIWGSWWKMSAFGTSFLVSVFFHTAIMFVLLPFQVSLIAILGNVFAKSSIHQLLTDQNHHD